MAKTFKVKVLTKFIDSKKSTSEKQVLYEKGQDLEFRDEARVTDMVDRKLVEIVEVRNDKKNAKTKSKAKPKKARKSKSTKKK